jgi:hypothetical protein
MIRAMTTCTRDRLSISMMPTAAITAFMVGLPHKDRKKARTLKQWAADVKSAMLRRITQPCLNLN